MAPWELEKRPRKWISRAIQIMNTKIAADADKESDRREREELARDNGA